MKVQQKATKRTMTDDRPIPLRPVDAIAAATVAPPSVDPKQTSANLRKVEHLAIEARKYLGVVAVDVLDGESTIACGMTRPFMLDPKASEALRELSWCLTEILGKTRSLLRKHGAEADDSDEFSPSPAEVQ